jgi:DNA-binding CsgD family transcriptional regulator/tetratricopeptide (TPR) repeat protein
MGRTTYLGPERLPILPILEREHSLQQLHAWVTEARSGAGRLAFVAGEAGIGKTVLVRTFADTLTGLARVALGACDALTTPRPLGPLDDVAAQLNGATLRGLRDGAPPDRLLRAFLSDLAAGASVVVFEDVHWADEATLDLLRFTGRRIAGTRSMLIATYRSDEVGPRHPLTAVLGDLATAEAVRRLSLAPLSVGAVEILARGSGLIAADLHRLTGGNPFFVTEILAAGGSRIPTTVSDAVLARAARLSAPARAVLETAAVIGARIEPWLLRLVAPEEAPAVEECLERGILRAEGATLAFRHELGREAVLASLSPQRALDLHRAVLHGLRSSPAASADPGRLAHHAEAAGDGPAVIALAASAGKRAAVLGAHREAAAQFARALRFADTLPPEERAALLEAFAEQCWLTDQLDRAIAADQEAMQIWHALGSRHRQAQAQLRLARSFVRNGRNADAEQATRSALEILEPLGPSRELGAAYRSQAMLRMMDRQNRIAVDWGMRAIELAERFGDRETTIMAHNFVGSALILAGDAEGGRRFLHRSLALAREADLPDLVAWGYWNLGSASGEVFDLPTAEGALRQGMAYCLEHDLDTAHAYMQAWLAIVAMYQGRWSDAEQQARAVLARPHTAATSRIMALVALGRLLVRRGDHPEGSAALEEALELALPTGTLQRIAPVRAARAEAMWLAGNAADAAEEARAAYDLALNRAHPWFIGELAYWLWRGGALAAPPEPCAEPFARQISGDAAGAGEAWMRLSCPYEAGRALADASDEAGLRQALEIFERLGARPMRAAVTRRLRTMGVKGLPRGPRPATRAHPAGLTPREVEIVAWIAQGLHNAEIAQRMYISVKTVDHHVSSVLTKLGVRSRAEVVREAARLGLLHASGAARDSRTG